MSPALIRYAIPPKPRLVRHFLIGLAAGLAGLYVGQALFVAIEDTQTTTCVYRRSDR